MDEYDFENYAQIQIEITRLEKLNKELSELIEKRRKQYNDSIKCKNNNESYRLLSMLTGYVSLLHIKENELIILRGRERNLYLRITNN